MKNNFITKIIGATLAFAVMIGGAVGINAAKQAKEVNADSSGDYQLVTSTTGITAGDTVIIVNHAANKAIKSISTTSTHYGLLETVSASNSKINLASSAAAEFVVRTGSSAGSFAFEGVSTNGANGGTAITNGKYLYWTSGNSLDVNATLSNKTSWTLNSYVSANGMTIANCSTTTRVIRFNSDRFACYTSSTGTLVDIYKKTANTSVTGVSVSPTSVTLGVGATQQLTPTIAPADATVKDVSYSSGNTNVATVSASGLITAVAAGNTTITVTTQDGGFTATCEVTVTAPISVTGVSLNKDSTTIEAGSTETLVATISPANASNKSVNWSSSDTNVATVTGGVVTAVTGGSATITATTIDGGFTATCEVTVTVPTSVTFVGGTDTGTNGASGNPDSISKKGITISGTNMATTTAEYRIYKDSTLTISSAIGNMCAIEFTGCDNSNKISNISTTVATGTVTVNANENTASWVGNANSVSFTLTAQGRASQIVVTMMPTTPTVTLDKEEINLKTNELAGKQVTATVYNVDNPNFIWTPAAGNNVTVHVDSTNGNTQTVTIKPNTNTTVDTSVTVSIENTTATATVLIHITEPEPGETAGTAFTVAEAIEHIDDVGNDGKEYYATGIVSEIVTPYNSQYGNITYNISSDGSTESAQLQAYRGKSFNGENFTSEDDIEVGATVIILGRLTKYNTTYEFTEGNKLASYTAAPRFTVSFNSLGGSEIQNQSIKKGSCINPLPTPTKAKDTVNQKKFTFEGWYTSANPFTEQNRFTSSTPVNSDLTLFAKYNETNYYVVTFNTNGGNAIDPQEVNSGNTVIMPDNPTKASDSSYSYTFEGWYKNAGLTESFDASQAITSNLILYAKYIEEAITTPEAYLNNASSVATIHATENAAENGNAHKTMTEVVTENSWTVSAGTNVTCYTNFDLDEKINVSTTGEANCGSFWGSTTQEWRLYQNKNGDLIITAANGYELTSATLTFGTSNGGILKLGNTTVTSGSEVILSGSTATFTVNNSGQATNGQVKITEIAVSYTKPLEVSNVALRFGVSISQSDWNGINDNNEHPDWEITDYGVMFLKKGTLDNYGFASVEAAFRANDPLKPVTIKHKGSGEAPYLDNGNYLFTIKVSFPDDTSYYDDVICAAPFIKVNDTYYFLEEKQESVNSLAGYYKTHEGSSLSSDALTYLSTAH